jgi:hypothetical protein
MKVLRLHVKLMIAIITWAPDVTAQNQQNLAISKLSKSSEP